ncbi:hypothetical protein IF2G_11023 [Cordyceps javanica]|nr:hypothetical protein IF2G_11023 [Cordyceps javanica]
MRAVRLQGPSFGVLLSIIKQVAQVLLLSCIKLRNLNRWIHQDGFGSVLALAVSLRRQRHLRCPQ